MKRLFIIIVSLVVLVFMVSPAIAIQYCKDFLEPGNPGGWGTSAKTWDEEITMAVTEEIYIDVWINDLPEPLITGGFWIVYEPDLMSIINIDGYDDNDLSGPWGYPSQKIADPAGPGTYFFLPMWVTPPGVIPDEDGDIILGRVRLRCEAEGDATITIMPIPEFDTNVGWPSVTLYDHQITPNTIALHQINSPCCTHISPDPAKVFSGETMQFTANKSGTCNPPSYVWSDDCTNAEIDPVTGVFTIEVIETEEVCSVCVIDTANTFSCTEPECDPPTDCCTYFTITNDMDDDGIADDDDNCPKHPNGPDLGSCIHGTIGEICTDNGECGSSGFCSMAQEDDYPLGGNGIGEACECEGDFDEDGDVDGTDASQFKADFGRSDYNDPCAW